MSWHTRGDLLPTAAIYHTPGRSFVCTLVWSIIENIDTIAVEEIPAVAQITDETSALIQKCGIDDGV